MALMFVSEKVCAAKAVQTPLQSMQLPTTSALDIRICPDKGRGVFAKRRFQAGDIIERVPVIPIPAEEEPGPGTVLYNYLIAWGPDGKDSALALGFGSIYNHSYEPNAFYERREGELCIDFIALRPIDVGEEILVNYNKDPDCRDNLWFDAK